MKREKRGGGGGGGQKQSNKRYRCKMAQTSAIWIQAAHQTNYLVNRSHTKKEEKILSLNKKDWRTFWSEQKTKQKKSQENGSVVEKMDWTERTGLGRRITEEIGGGLK